MGDSLSNLFEVTMPLKNSFPSTDALKFGEKDASFLLAFPHNEYVQLFCCYFAANDPRVFESFRFHSPQ